jgi:pyrimidine operon attenuation protein/uracil phosphoribosyltransferase
LENKVVILVDDVLNSGRTLAFALQPFLQRPIKKLEVAVLVNRAHKRYPVSVDYAGYELATTLNEHIQVNLQGVEMAVHLL